MSDPSPDPFATGTLCIAAPRMAIYSETFVAQHVARLVPGRTRVLYKEPIAAEWDGPRVVTATIAQRLAWRAGRKLGLDLRERDRVRSLAAWLRMAKARAVLAEFGPTAVEMVDPCRRANVPLVAHFHGYDAYADHALQEQAQGYPKLFAAAAAVVAVSGPMVEQLASIGCPREKLHRIPCGVDPDEFPAADPAAAPPHLLGVGRFVEKKAPFLTLLAFAAVARDRPDARLTLAGDGYLLETCRELAGGLGLADRVAFPGPVDHAAVGQLMRRSRAYVQHSIRPAGGDREGTPVSVVEASASGLPVVSTRHGGIPEAVLDGTTGLLVDERDVTAMAAALRRLIDDPPLARSMGEAGRAHVATHYALASQIAQLRAVLDRAAAPPDRQHHIGV